MPNNTTLINAGLVSGASVENFEGIAMQLFHYQYNSNDIYRQYCDALKINVGQVSRTADIPFLPISFFKTHRVVTGPVDTPASLVFESSGTTGEVPSRHYVADPVVYERSLLDGFIQFYGPPSEYAILALLPSYLERKNASLVHMAHTLMDAGGHPDNGFYINEWEQLSAVLTGLERAGQKTLLLGVTFALLDFAEAYPMQLLGTIVMETGGMKGRKQEMTRSEVHGILKKQWGLEAIHSEYGMTELLSQAYSGGQGIFNCTHTMQVFVRDINDPLDVKRSGTGAINIIDLANIHSCSFIATEDIGNIYPNGSFEVLGRMDNSALRGCSLMTV